jgi:MazG family protein
MEELARLKEITTVLRGPHGCEWDRAQDFESMRPHLIEEAYEVLDAIEHFNPDDLKEELGDLLFLVFFFSRLAEERELFELSDVAEGVAEKLVRRHPHVFGDVQVSGVADILENWEAIKKEEKKDKSDEKPSLMDGVTRTMPALFRAYKTQQKAARTGFDWNSVDGVFDKLQEEIGEIQQAAKNVPPDYTSPACPPEVENEIGDLIFTAVNLARKMGANPETALNKAVDRFQDRFRLMETYAGRSFVNLKNLSEAQLEELWEKAKKEIASGVSVR